MVAPLIHRLAVYRCYRVEENPASVAKTHNRGAFRDHRMQAPMPVIFYIDDSRDDLFYLEYIRKKERVSVDLFCFATAEAALAALEDRSAERAALPDVLIADLYMPLDSGLALIARLRAQDRFKTMRLCVCSGSDAEEDRQRALVAGADSYLQKPLDFAAILHPKTSR
ncbi:response regulator receiver domain-containing protein [Rhizobium azibense]|uniref:Response regulator receiver domain-containing protein n=2 Tax=Rhizobium azibense TaxID=1136135 RepID=A0A4R3R566_9HYPH|nr:response regulator receiver domain-containing protein [Rhizobium azibense]